MSDKQLIVRGCVLLALIALVNFVGSFFIAVNTDTDRGGGCFAVAFDKADVLNADKVVIRENGMVITITDKDLVREISSCFTVANSTDQCDSRSGSVWEIYKGDKLLRTIVWNGCCENCAVIYHADALHWLFPSESGLGQLELPRDVYNHLRTIVANYDG